MPQPSTRPTFSDWHIADRAEPSVRVGIVLAEDRATTLRLLTPPRRGVLSADAGTEPVHLSPATELVATAADGVVTVTQDGTPLVRGSIVRLAEVEPLEFVPIHAGVGTLVHDVVAGRGFHWQKRIDQHLPGVVELRAMGSHLVLVNELLLEQYLVGVITAEMGAECPVSLLAAQAVVARSWLLARTEAKHVNDPFDRCNDDCCQRYQGTDAISDAALTAIRLTFGEVLLTPGGAVLDANYSKSCGGIAETPESVWGVAKPGVESLVDAPSGDPVQGFYPVTDSNVTDYLGGDWAATSRAYCSPQVVSRDAIGRYLGRVDTVDDYFRWQVTLGRTEVEAALRAADTRFEPLATLTDLAVTARGVSGRAERVDVTWLAATGASHTTTLEREYAIRAGLHPHFLYSSAILIECERAADGTLSGVTLRGAGWGHGVGLCQIGALGMALTDHDHVAICTHYFPAARLERVYPRGTSTGAI